MNRFVFVLLLLFPIVAAAEEVLIPATDVVEKVGTVVAPEPKYDGLAVLHGVKGSAMWKFKIEKEGDYRVQALYASGQKRPCKITVVSGNFTVGSNSAFEAETGGFLAKELKWVDAGLKTKLLPGEYSLTISVEKSMPHFRGFRITTDETLPTGDPFAAVVLEKQRQAEQKEWNEYEQKASVARKMVQELLPGVSQIVFVKRATFQSSHYYTDFIDGVRDYNSELCVLNLVDGSVKNLVPSLKNGVIGRCNLSFDGKKVIFDYKEKLGVGFRIWEVGIDGTGLRQLTIPPDDEAERIAKYRMDKQNTVNQTWATYKGIGAGLYVHHTDDFHPAYLPDGNIVFASTRCEHGILCDGPDVLTASVLYRADKDGKNLEKLSNNSVSESCPTIMEDGRILYTRWEYVDNGSVTNKGLWALNPDGTASVEIYGANIAYPSVFNTARQIPGHPTEFVCIGAPHMPLGVGTVLRVDTRFNRRTVDGVQYVTPEVDCQYQWGWQKPANGKPFVKLYEPPEVANSCLQTNYSRDGRGNTSSGPLFMDPFPVNEHDFLVSHNPNKAWNVVNAYGLYYINDSGDREPFYRDKELSAWCPIPVRVTPVPGMPTVTKDPKLAEKNLAHLIVVDVYAGMDNVKRGAVKYLRINEHVPRPWTARRFWDGDLFDQQHSVISKNAALGLRVQHGIVPVEEDGSANFVVPADKNIFIQALDENYREIQRERTFVNFRPGEVRSCVGCHERASESPMPGTKGTPLALRRQYDVPGPQPGEKSGSRPISYFEDVQPVLDRHCVQCHNSEKTEGKINLEGTLTTLFNRSYETLIDWKSFSVIGENHPKAGNNHYLPPYSLGSYESKLIKLLDAGHYDVKMPKEDWIRLTTWVDSNGQYYGTYFGHKNLQYKDLPDFRHVPTFEEIETATPQGN